MKRSHIVQRIDAQLAPRETEEERCASLVGTPRVGTAETALKEISERIDGSRLVSEDWNGVGCCNVDRESALSHDAPLSLVRVLGTFLLRAQVVGRRPHQVRGG